MTVSLETTIPSLTPKGVYELLDAKLSQSQPVFYALFLPQEGQDVPIPVVALLNRGGDEALLERFTDKLPETIINQVGSMALAGEERILATLLFNPGTGTRASWQTRIYASRLALTGDGQALADQIVTTDGFKINTTREVDPTKDLYRLSIIQPIGPANPDNLEPIIRDRSNAERVLSLFFEKLRT